MSQVFDQPDMTTAAAYATIPLDPLPLDGASSTAYTADPSSSSYPAYYSLPPADAYSASAVYDLSPSQQQQQQTSQPQQYAPQYQLSPVPAVPSSSSSSSAPPSSAAMLMQQHQANQQAFRSNQASTVFQQNHVAANQGDSNASGSSADPSREGSAGSNGSGQNQQQNGDEQQNGDGDFTQTFYDPFKIKHRRRTSPPQLKVLEYHFEINSKPDVTLRKALSEQLDMTPREVQVWFQNRRAKVKKLREKAEREAAAAAEEAARKGEVYEPKQAVAAAKALNAPASELPVPPAFAQPFAPTGRTIYGQQPDLLSLRRGSSPAIFGASASSALPTPPLAFETSFQPVPTAAPFQHLAQNQPFPPSAYPSPASLATTSPNDFLNAPPPGVQDFSQPPPPHVPAYLAGEIAAGPTGGISRRFSLPAYSSSYLPTPSEMPKQPMVPPLYQPQQQLGMPHSLAPHQAPPHSVYAVSAPTESAYLDQLGPPLPAQIDALSISSGVLDGNGVPLDGHSPSSSLGEPALSWDGQSQPFPLDGVPEPHYQQVRPTYAPAVPSQLGSRRASCPEGPGAFPQQQQQQHNFNHLGAPAHPGAHLAWSDQPPHDGLSAASPFYGYSMAPSSSPSAAHLSTTNPSLPSPHVSPHPPYAQPLPPSTASFSRRGSVAAPLGGLTTIAEQPPPLPSFDPSALAGALAPHQQQQGSETPSPPALGLGERRGSVIRKARSTRENLHSPYAAAAQERGGGGGGFDGAAL